MTCLSRNEKEVDRKKLCNLLNIPHHHEIYVVFHHSMQVNTYALIPLSSPIDL